MNSKNTLSITEARKKFFQIMAEVQRPDSYYVLTERGRPRAVIMSAQEFESWQETVDTIRDCPNLMQDIKQAEEDFAKGNYVTLEEVLAEQGYVLADKAKKKYAVSSNRAKKNTKKAK